MSSWNDPYLKELFLKSTPLIDVRAPVEFEDGAIPNSVNLPILTNDERAQVGTMYKTEGQGAAIKLGHELVNGKVKEQRIEAWSSYIKKHPETQVFCFRGGLRSQTACQWLREAGIERSPIEGGYKRLRKFLLSWLEEAPKPTLHRIGGLTGTGKTILLNQLPNALDIEGLAHHRGSAFGGHSLQPAQITFENNLALGLLRNYPGEHLVVEDESATLGRVTLPMSFFSSLRQSPLIILRVDFEQRIQNIFRDYVKGSNVDFFLAGLDRIKKRLSGSNFETMRQEMQRAFQKGLELKDHEAWISMLLRLYYDPLYEKDIRKNSHLIAFEGNEQEVRQYLAKICGYR